jgi:nicotinamide-nucleotide amidase
LRGRKSSPAGRPEAEVGAKGNGGASGESGASAGQWIADSELAQALFERAQRVGDLLHAQRAWLTTAESCTAGGVAYAVTQIAGSSAWFDRGFVTYTNAAKTALLGVPERLLDAHGAVSEPVARAMAGGALVASGAQVAVAITGIAGPGGGSPAKPVGTVCFAWAKTHGAHAATGARIASSMGQPVLEVNGTADSMVGPAADSGFDRDAVVVTATRRFAGDRAAVRSASVLAALQGLIDLLESGG